MNNCGKFFSSPLVPLTPRAMKVNISDKASDFFLHLLRYYFLVYQST